MRATAVFVLGCTTMAVLSCPRREYSSGRAAAGLEQCEEFARQFCALAGDDKACRAIRVDLSAARVAKGPEITSICAHALESRVTAAVGDSRMRRSQDLIEGSSPCAKVAGLVCERTALASVCNDLAGRASEFNDAKSFAAKSGARDTLGRRANARAQALEMRCTADLVAIEQAYGRRVAEFLAKGSPRSEVRTNLRHLLESAKAYYEDEFASRTGELLTGQLPPSAGPTPADSPCVHPGRRYPSRVHLWDSPTWFALNFQLEQPHYYRYTFISQRAGSLSAFTVRANGDLNCNGVWSTFEMVGRADGSGRIIVDRETREVRPLE